MPFLNPSLPLFGGKRGNGDAVFIHRGNSLTKKKIVDLYVHEIKVFADRIDVVLKIDLGADKGGVGGGTCPHSRTLREPCVKDIITQFHFVHKSQKIK